jgi:hypothetical protein
VPLPETPAIARRCACRPAWSAPAAATGASANPRAGRRNAHVGGTAQGGHPRGPRRCIRGRVRATRMDGDSAREPGPQGRAGTGTGATKPETRRIRHVYSRYG